MMTNHRNTIIKEAEAVFAELPNFYHDETAFLLLSVLIDYEKPVFIFIDNQTLERTYEDARGLYKSIVQKGKNCNVYQGKDFAITFAIYHDANPQVVGQFVYPLAVRKI